MPMISPRLPFIRSCIGHHSLIHYARAPRGHPRPLRIFVYQDVDGRDKPGHDTIPLEFPQNHASRRLKTNVALVPPKPKEFDRTVPILALSIRLRTIGMSAKTGSSSVMCALSQMNPLFIMSSE